MQITDYLTINTIRNVLDISLVFILVYVVLKLLRGTRGVPTVVGLILLGLLYWISIEQDFELSNSYSGTRSSTSVLRSSSCFNPRSDRRFIYFANRLRLSRCCGRRRSQFGGSVYDEIVLAVTTLASEKIGALIVVERKIGLRNFIDAGVQLDARDQL